MRCGKESAYMMILHIISRKCRINGGVWWCSGMIFDRSCRHFDGILVEDVYLFKFLLGK